MARLWLENLVSYSLQIAVVAVAGALLLRLLRIRIPKVRLICWQALIAACLLLPAIQPWLAWKNSSGVQIAIGPATASDPAHHTRTARFPVTPSVLVLVGAGAVVRFAVLGLGFCASGATAAILPSPPAPSRICRGGWAFSWTSGFPAMSPVP